MKLYTVEPKGNKLIIAICYDFDKTLSPTDMQAQGYIQSVNCDVTAFWRESNDLANKNGKDKSKVQKMIHDDRISYYAEADYRKGKALERIVKAIIDQTSSNEAIESIKTKCIKETKDAYDGKTIEEQKRKDLIIELDNSSSFTNTHTVVKKLKHIDWNAKEREEMYRIALINTQIFSLARRSASMPPQITVILFSIYLYFLNNFKLLLKQY